MSLVKKLPDSRWKPLEGALALLGGVADDLRSVLEKDITEHRPVSFEIRHLFDQVIPGLLALTGK